MLNGINCGGNPALLLWYLQIWHNRPENRTYYPLAGGAIGALNELARINREDMMLHEVAFRETRYLIKRAVW